MYLCPNRGPHQVPLLYCTLFAGPRSQFLVPISSSTFFSSPSAARCRAYPGRPRDICRIHCSSSYITERLRSGDATRPVGRTSSPEPTPTSPHSCDLREPHVPYLLWASAIIFGLCTCIKAFAVLPLPLSNMGASLTLDLLTADAKTLQGLLSNGSASSRALVEAYLAQIEKHDRRLHAMIQTAPRDLLLTTADQLDAERKAGKFRGPRSRLLDFVAASPGPCRSFPHPTMQSAELLGISNRCFWRILKSDIHVLFFVVRLHVAQITCAMGISAELGTKLASLEERYQPPLRHCQPDPRYLLS